jgi:hypothetical protein
VEQALLANTSRQQQQQQQQQHGLDSLSSQQQQRQQPDSLNSQQQQQQQQQGLDSLTTPQARVRPAVQSAAVQPDRLSSCEIVVRPYGGRSAVELGMGYQYFGALLSPAEERGDAEVMWWGGAAEGAEEGEGQDVEGAVFGPQLPPQLLNWQQLPLGGPFWQLPEQPQELHVQDQLQQWQQHQLHPQAQAHILELLQQDQQQQQGPPPEVVAEQLNQFNELQEGQPQGQQQQQQQ